MRRAAAGVRGAGGVSVLVAACAAAALAACSKVDAPASAATPPPPIATAAPASDPTLASTLCGVLRKKAPELKGMPPVGARAQLVMAIANAFDVNAVALATVSSEIDAIAASGCAEVRAPLLAATGAASLQEAVQ